MAPASLYEATYCESPSLRRALLNAMALPAWKRMLPEAYSESEEIKAEVRRCRPEWLRTEPKLHEWRALRHDWVRHRGGAWDRAVRRPVLIKNVQGPSLDRERTQARELRDEALEWSSKWQRAPLQSILVADSGEGQGEAPFEMWRSSAMTVFSNSVSDRAHAYAEWLDPEVDLDLMLFQRASLRRFWVQDVQSVNMPRHWLRWAFEFMQRMHKVTDGTPVDCQLGTYLLDVDLFLSADKVLVGIAERCRREAPFNLATSAKVPGGDAAVDAVLEAIRS